MTTTTAIPSTVLRWFTGKSLTYATMALQELNVSIAQGFWVPGASRSVRAAMTKANVAANLARKHGKMLTNIGKRPDDVQFNTGTGIGRDLDFQLRYGASADLMECGAKDTLLSMCTTELESTVVDTAFEFVMELHPVAVAMRTLDATRPPAVFTSIGVSPTLTATLADMKINASKETIGVVPMEFVKELRTNPKTGKQFQVVVCHLLWPAGTKHNTSAHVCNHTGMNEKCHACGHAIKNGMNWVPLLAHNTDGQPLSLWVGRDCAKRLFGVDMKGDLELATGERHG